MFSHPVLPLTNVPQQRNGLNPRFPCSDAVYWRRFIDLLKIIKTTRSPLTYVAIKHPKLQKILGAATSKIHVADIQDGRQPAATPGPGHDNWVDEAGHQEGKDGVGGALHTFRHSATHDGGSSCAEGPLEEPAQPRQKTSSFLQFAIADLHVFDKQHAEHFDVILVPDHS